VLLQFGALLIKNVHASSLLENGEASVARIESLFQLDPEPLAEMHQYLDLVSRQWDRSLARLKAFVEG
jgi:hypothetical protein